MQRPRRTSLGTAVPGLASGTRGDDDMTLDEKEVDLFLGKGK